MAIIKYKDKDGNIKTINVILGPKGDKGEKGDKGDKGDPGVVGVGIAKFEYYYKISDTEPTIPLQYDDVYEALKALGWKANCPIALRNLNIWKVLIITYTNNITLLAGPILIPKGDIGEKGDLGDKGADFKYEDFTPDLLEFLRLPSEDLKEELLEAADNAITAAEEANTATKDTKTVIVEARDIINKTDHIALQTKDVYTMVNEAYTRGDFKGDKGDVGPKGDKGNDGYIPIKDVDYFDGKDLKFKWEGTRLKIWKDGLFEPETGINLLGATGKEGHTPVITSSKDSKGITTIKVDNTPVALIADGLQGAKGDKGEDGTGVRILPSADDCKEAGDAYINQSNGHILIYDTNTLTFVDGGEIKGPKGDTGEKGEKGETGLKGLDGHTPIITATKNGNTTKILADNIEIALIVDGLKGDKGEDGYTPNITAVTIDGVTTLKKDGTPIATIHDGAKGDKGETGLRGIDGTSISAYWQGTNLIIVSNDRELEPVNLKGETGAKGDKGITDEEHLAIINATLSANNASSRANIAALDAYDAAGVAVNAANAANEAATSASNINVTIEGTNLSITNKEGYTTTVNTKGQPGENISIDIENHILKDALGTQITIPYLNNNIVNFGNDLTFSYKNIGGFVISDENRFTASNEEAKNREWNEGKSKPAPNTCLLGFKTFNMGCDLLGKGALNSYITWVTLTRCTDDNSNIYVSSSNIITLDNNGITITYENTPNSSTLPTYQNVIYLNGEEGFIGGEYGRISYDSMSEETTLSYTKVNEEDSMTIEELLKEVRALREELDEVYSSVEEAPSFIKIESNDSANTICQKILNSGRYCNMIYLHDLPNNNNTVFGNSNYIMGITSVVHTNAISILFVTYYGNALLSFAKIGLQWQRIDNLNLSNTPSLSPDLGIL